MRHPVAFWAAVIATLVLFASLQNPALAASRGNTPQVRLAPQEEPPSTDGLIVLVASASAGAPSAGSRDTRVALSTESSINVNSAPGIPLIRGLAKAEAGVSVEERTLSSAATASFPSLNQFISTVKNPNASALAGVYVADVLALKVVSYPAGNPLSVTALPGYVTQSCGIEHCPSVGLLAHNFLAGALFSRLSPNEEVTLIYGDGSAQRFRVSKIKRFQALNPTDPYSEFVDLDKGSQELSSTDVFNQTFGVGRQVVFQTCISANGNLSWGRLFVIADPV